MKKATLIAIVAIFTASAAFAAVTPPLSDKELGIGDFNDHNYSSNPLPDEQDQSIRFDDSH